MKLPSTQLLHVLTALALLFCIALPNLAQEQERTLTQEQLDALDNGEDLVDLERPERPANLPDLTRGEQVAGEREDQDTWHLGPTGIIGYMPGGLRGDQIEVTSVLPGSPAEGQLQWGDVILSVNGQMFVAGENMGIVFGNAIIDSELEENNGVLTLRVWRDSNFIARNGRRNIAGADIDRLIADTVDDSSLFEWNSEQEREAEVRSSNFDQFPIQGEYLDITLQLAVLPPYSDTSPYDCPKTQYILEHAWPILEAQLAPDAQGRFGRGGTLQALALAASGREDHRQLVRDWIRSPQGRVWHPPTEQDDPIIIPGKSWYMGFTGLDCALYYEATGDEFVRPALERFAVRTARGQSGGGSWGHNWAQPVFNGGQLHGMNPGYGAVNASGNRCFFLITLAQSLGIEDPEIDAAVERSRTFFDSYTDKGGIPYGHHGAAETDDSNGKNTGVAFSLMLLGDLEGAQYWAQMSTHASFTRRGGHGDDYFWHWSPWAATLCGPRGVIATHRNMRWWYTLCRRFDGGFVNHSPTGSGPLRDPTATYVLHYSAPLQQTLITGSHPHEEMFWDDESFAELLASARSQLNNPELIEEAGTPWAERSTDELFDILDIFMPKARRLFATELANRYHNGEAEILPRFAALLESDNPRFREAACRGLAACGTDASLQYLSGVARLLSDPNEFVRMQAARTMASAAQDPEVQLALLRATVDDDVETMSPNSLPSLTQGILFSGESTLANSPFQAGLDEALVRDALEKLITLDPTGNRAMMSSRLSVWDRDTVIRMAGPIVYTAEQEQIADQMFSSRRTWSLSLLQRMGYQESIDASASYLHQYGELPRQIRARVSFKRGLIEPEIIMANPAAAVHHLDAMQQWLLDKPLAGDGNWLEGRVEPEVYLYQVIAALQAVQEPQMLPSLADDAHAYFQTLLDQADSEEARIALCRAELADPARFNYFRKINALNYLAQTLGDDAMADIIPYIGHDHWRLRQLAHDLAAQHATGSSSQALLIQSFANARPAAARGILAIVAQTKTEAGRALAEQALMHSDPAVRGSAIQALFEIAGDAALTQVYAFMQNATSAAELAGCESALQSRLGDPAFAAGVRSQMIAMLPNSEPVLRDTLYWMLAQIGDAQSLATLQQASATEDDDEFRSIAVALSYSPAPEADEVVLSIIRANANTPRAEVIATEGIRRMVISPQGIGNRPISEQLDYAETVLNIVLDNATIAYLGRIRTGRCAYILQQAMRRGAPASAAMAIIRATADLGEADATDRRMAEQALIDVIEFIEVTYIRGDATDRVAMSRDEQRAYIQWRIISQEAGRNLLQIARPQEAPLPEFDDSDLDL